jgi:uncharacterized protein (DUF2164 family)
MPDKDGKAERAEAVGRIQTHFRAERGEELGDLAAGFLLDFIERELGPAFYNRGVRDAKAVALRSAATLDEELDALEARVLPTKSRGPGSLL